MSTIYTDQLFNLANLSGITSGGFWTTSSLNNELQLLSAGTISGGPFSGLLYNQSDWATGGNFNSGAATPVTVTVVPYLSGAHTGDAPSTFTVTVSAATPIPFGVLSHLRFGVNLLYTTGTTTYAADLSASTYDISSKGKRRHWLLGLD